jgi:hypothetical protein
MSELSVASTTYSSRQIQTWFWILLALNIAFIIWSRNFLYPLESKDIVQFELAKKVPIAESIIAAWKTPDDLKFEQAIQSIYLDYLFIILYTTGLAIACVFLSQLTGHQILKRTGRLFVFIIIGAGIFDIIENSAMLNSLAGHLNNWNVVLAYDMAVAKFSLILLSLIFLFVCLIFYMLRKLSKE